MSVGAGRALALALALVAVPGATPAAAAPPALGPLLERLGRASAEVETLAGEFTQRSRIKLFKQELTSTGRLLYRRPRRLRWQYLAPDPSTLVLDGDQATLTSPGAAPRRFDLAREPALRTVFDQLSLWLGAGSLAEADKSYQLGAGGSAARPSLSLTPRPGSPIAATFAHIELRFDERLLLAAIVLVERSGDEKEIVFSRLRRNEPLPEAAFSP